MVERASSRASHEKEEWRTDDGYQIEGQEEDELGDLTEREGGVDGRGGGLAKLLYGIGGVLEENAGRGNEGGETFADECCLRGG